MSDRLKIYVASSWRNALHPAVVEALRPLAEVYDFRNPPNKSDFRWLSLDPNYRQWTASQFIQALESPLAEEGFSSDMQALEDCDLCVLVLPCGRSAHLELGYAVGAGKVTIVLIPDAQERVLGHTMDCRPCATCGDLDGCHMPAKLRNALEPELMYKMCNHIVTSVGGLVDLISFLVTGMGSSEAEQPHATTA